MNLDDPRLPQRFWDKVMPEPNSGCWLWTGGADRYGGFRVRSRQVGAHRAAYQALVGPIPNDLELDHRCNTPLCVNPDHLRPMTHRANLLRGTTTIASVNAVKTHCPRGHDLDGDNVYRRPDGKSQRECLICRRESARRANAKRRG